MQTEEIGLHVPSAPTIIVFGNYFYFYYKMDYEFVISKKKKFSLFF